MKLEISKNAHPNTDGSPWGWIKLDSTRIRVATWSGHEEKKYCETIVTAVNNFDKMKEAIESLLFIHSAGDLSEKEIHDKAKQLLESLNK